MPTIPSSVLRATPAELATPASKAVMDAWNGDTIQLLGEASTSIGQALKSSTTGFGATPKGQVTRAIEHLDEVPGADLISSEARDSVVFARELLANTMAGRQGNAWEVLKFRETALTQARTAVDTAAMKETLARMAEDAPGILT